MNNGRISMEPRSTTSVAATGGVSFGTLLALVFVVAKLWGKIDWSWVWVFAPMWIPFGLMIVVLVIALVFGAIVLTIDAARDRKRDKKRTGW